MYTTRATPSRHGSLSRNGALGAQQRARQSMSLRQSRPSFLERVDEEEEREHSRAAARSHGGCSSETEVWSPTNSALEFSSDEDVENCATQSRVKARRSSGAYDGKRPSHSPSGASRRGSTVSKRYSPRPPLQTVPLDLQLRFQRANRRGSHAAPPVVATSLDEKKHKKLVALFYWRRRTLETYLSAWKWVVFELRRSRDIDQEKELALLRPYAPVPARHLDKRPRHQSTLLRNTMERQRRESVVSFSASASRDDGASRRGSQDRLHSIRDEYRQMKAASQQRQALEHAAIEARRDEQNDEERAALRKRLRIYFQYFEAWREFHTGRQHLRTIHEEKAARHYTQRLVRQCLRAWSGLFVVMRRAKRTQWSRACESGDAHTKRRRFVCWRNDGRWKRVAAENSSQLLRIQVRNAVTRWQQWTTRKVLLQNVDVRRRRSVLKSYLHWMRVHTRESQQRKVQRALALDCYRRQLTRSVWSHWVRSVFAGESAVRGKKLAIVVASKAAVNKWKRFVAKRRKRHADAVEADCLLYEGLLRRFWARWGRFVSLRHQKKAIYDRAEFHYLGRSRRSVVKALLVHQCARRYAKDRARGARLFYAQRLAKQLIQAWAVYVAVQAQARRVEVTRVKRQVVLCFVAWRQHTASTRHLGSVVTAVACRRDDKLASRALLLWRRRYRLSRATSIVTAWYVCRTLRNHFRVWRLITSERIQHRGFLKGLHARRVRKLQQDCLNGWRAAVVGARCRRRLVSLFQKKQLCKRLRRCVKAMAQFAKQHHLERTLRMRHVQSAWHSWMIFTADQQQRAEAMQIAIQFYSSRRYRFAVHMWRENARRDVQLRLATTKSIGLLIRHTMKTSLYMWYRNARTRKRRRELVQAHTRKRHLRLARRLFITWNHVVRARYRRRTCLHQLWVHAMLRLRQRAFGAWIVYHNHRVAKERVMEEAIARYKRGRKRNVLLAWSASARRLRLVRTAVEIVSCRYRHNVLQRTIDEWRSSANLLRHDRSSHAKAIAFHREFLLLWVFYGWQHAALDDQVRREKQRRVARQVNAMRLKRAICLWRSKLDIRTGSKQSQMRAVQFYQRRRRKRGIHAWKTFVTRRHDHRVEQKRAHHFASKKLLRRVFRSWLQFTSGTRTFKLKLRTIFQTGEDDTQRRVFRCWRRYKRSSTLRARADQWRGRLLLRTIWSHWRAQVVFTHKMRSNLLLTSRLLQSNAARSTFVRWKMYVESCHRRGRALRRADDHHTVHCYRLALRCFRVLMEDANADERAAAFRVQHSQRRCFVAWLGGVAEVKRRRELNARVLAQSRLNQKRKSFYGWKALVESKLRQLRSRVEKFNDALVLKHVWKAWKRVITCRRLENMSRTRRGHRELQAAFRQWNAYSREQRQIRRHVDAAVAHVDRVVMEKIWQRWQEFLHERRHKHGQYAMAASFYSSRILVSSAFQAWTLYVDLRHMRQTQKCKADTFCRASVLRKSVGKLVAYVAHRHACALAKAAEDEAIQEMVVKTAIQKWRGRATTLHAIARNRAAAVEHFQHVASRKAIDALVEIRTARRQARRLTTQARSFHKQRLVRQSFLHWVKFVSWRHRHRRLLRLFRSNQLSDYFALWCKYVVRSKRKRELQTTATTGYRRLVLRSAFTRWSERRRLWTEKRRAIRWFSDRLARSVFAMWAHRVRVLRKIRTMFQFQDSYRLETHFQSWRRHWGRKKQQIVRLREALTWLTRHQQAKCFALWKRWLDEKRQERQTLRMAVGFRKRFFSRKYLTAWRGVIAWRQRERQLIREAYKHWEASERRRTFGALLLYTATKKRLADTAHSVEAAVTEMRLQRSIEKWKLRLDRRHTYERVVGVAQLHFTRTLLQAYWSKLQHWHGAQRVQVGKAKRAEAHHQVQFSRRLLIAWSDFVRLQRQIRFGLQRFKAKYFRNVADDCFLRWKAFANLKRKLRVLQRKAKLSRGQRMFTGWCKYTLNKRELRIAVAKLHQRRQQRLLRESVAHWESVATDRWMYRTLLRSSHRRRALKVKSLAMGAWKGLLVVRAARAEWRQRTRSRHANSLREVLRRWRQLAADAAQEDDDEAQHIRWPQ